MVEQFVPDYLMQSATLRAKENGVTVGEFGRAESLDSHHSRLLGPGPGELTDAMLGHIGSDQVG